MNKAGWRLISLLGAAAAATFATAAQAQATRTWVSGVGDDANPCSRTAPCRTFAGAISKTAAGGEINCLDPGAYGAVTITKSLSIVCEYTEAGVLATGGSTGIVVAAGTNDQVFLSGLDIEGAGTGGAGIRFQSGGTLHVLNSKIRGFDAGTAVGVAFTPSGASQLTLTNVVISDNGSGATGGGILLRTSGSAGARLILRSVLVHHNANNGLAIDTTGSSGASVTVLIDESQILGSSANAMQLTALGGSGDVHVMLTDSVVGLSGGSGIAANGAGVLVRVGGTSITANLTGVSTTSSGRIESYGTNRLDGNGTNGAFTATIPQR